MSRKFIQEYKNDNFVYPNNDPYEYGIEIIHDINNNSVSGLTSGFSAVLSGGNIVFSFTYQWFLNGATPFIMNNGDLSVLSVHMMEPTRTFFKPWRLVGMVSDNNPALTYKTDTVVYTVTPSMMGVSGFVSGTYYFEIRMIGKKAVYAICAEVEIVVPTPTPTPTHTPTPTPTPTPTISYELYLADEYDCETCTISATDVVVALPYGTSPNYGKFYVPLAIPGFVYLLSSPTLTGPGVILTTTNFTTCSDACSYEPPPPTPTPTPTATPTPTPTTTITPERYYYQGFICGSGIYGSFYSDTNLGDSPGIVVYAFSSIGGAMNQCFDSINRITTPNSNPILATFEDCSSCQSPSCTDWRIANGTGVSVTWSGISCSGTSTGGTVAAGDTQYTGCIIDGTLTYTGTPTVTVSAYC